MSGEPSSILLIADPGAPATIVDGGDGDIWGSTPHTVRADMWGRRTSHLHAPRGAGASGWGGVIMG